MRVNQTHVRMRCLFQKGSLSLYGSILLLIGAVIIYMVTNAGFKGTLYGVGILIIIGILIYLLKKLPELLAKGIVLGIMVTFFSVFLQSWLFTFLLVIFAIADMVTEGLDKDSRLAKLTTIVFLAVIIISGIWSSTYEPNLEQQVFREVEEEITKEDGVYNVTIMYNLGIDCTIVVDDEDMTFGQRQQLGEMCGKSLSDKVDPKRDVLGKSDRSLGYLYDYYSLHVDVLVREEDNILRGTKYTSDENITWTEQSIYGSGE